MQDSAALGHLVLGYSPFVDRQRAVTATRLTVFADRSGPGVDAAALLRLLADVWPGVAGGGVDVAADGVALTLRSLDGVAPGTGRSAVAAASTPAAEPSLSLNITDEALLRSVIAAGAGPQLMIEVPAFMLADATLVAALKRLSAGGRPLLLKGQALAPIAADVLACFSHLVVEPGAAAPPPTRAGGAAAKRVAVLPAGGRTTAAVDAALAGGAAGVIGWLVDDAPPPPGARMQRGSDVQIVLELIQGVEQELPLARLEAVLRRDPSLAFRLMRFLNSPAFGLTVEVSSFSQALMLLGHQRLKRWLALLLASSGRSPNLRPLVFAAVRRGLLMEELGRGRVDADVRGEMFICGLFSLLDRLLQQPMDDLLRSVPVPDTVRAALTGAGGPHEPYLQLVAAIEMESRFDIGEAADRLLISSAEVNRSLLATLKSARQFDG